MDVLALAAEGGVGFDVNEHECIARGAAAGAGIKGTRRDREYTAAVASPGVKFMLKDGRSVFLGSPEPERLRAFVEANQRMPQDVKTRILAQLSQPMVPASMIERIEARMGG